MTDRAMEWDETIEKGKPVLLPEGDYPFRVVRFEKGHYEGSGKLPACNMAKLTLLVRAPSGEDVYCTEKLMLCESMQWKLFQFFHAIRPNLSDSFHMDWNMVPDATGRAHFNPRTFNGEQYNSVERYLPYDATAMMTPVEAVADVPW